MVSGWRATSPSMTRGALRPTPLVLAPVVAKSELVEVGLQVSGTDRARMRLQEAALKERH
jgi:hypothetical protein